MSLARQFFRVPATATRQCTRCISSSSRSGSDFNILDVLPGGRSPAQSHPSAPSPQRNQKLSPLSLARQALPVKKDLGREMQEFSREQDFTKHMYRRWRPGDVYAPHDLSGAEQKKWKTGQTRPQSDAFDVLGINPINEYKNYTMMSEFMTEMGRIKHSKQTGLRPVNQRKIAKAIRRAIGLGLMPSVHRHPLVLKKSSPTRFL